MGPYRLTVHYAVLHLIRDQQNEAGAATARRTITRALQTRRLNSKHTQTGPHEWPEPHSIIGWSGRDGKVAGRCGVG
jgi:hypothetical protein